MGTHSGFCLPPIRGPTNGGLLATHIGNPTASGVSPQAQESKRGVWSRPRLGVCACGPSPSVSVIPLHGGAGGSRLGVLSFPPFGCFHHTYIILQILQNTTPQIRKIKVPIEGYKTGSKPPPRRSPSRWLVHTPQKTAMGGLSPPGGGPADRGQHTPRATTLGGVIPPESGPSRWLWHITRQPSGISCNPYCFYALYPTSRGRHIVMP